jgi:ParB family chromosome partitioning protein
MDVIAIVIGETLFAGSAAIEAVGLHIGLDMAKWWSADGAFFEGLRDREVLTALVAEVGGAEVAAANTKEKGATLKAIVRDHLDGINGRTKVDGWVPKWMAFPPAGYTGRGAVETVTAHGELALADAEDEPERKAA